MGKHEASDGSQPATPAPQGRVHPRPPTAYLVILKTVGGLEGFKKHPTSEVFFVVDELRVVLVVGRARVNIRVVVRTAVISSNLEGDINGRFCALGIFHYHLTRSCIGKDK